ncbi:MAG TPA: hypothetical protein VNB06_04570 [Thermoanaerobaculia bacterium]|nr:hypothetical protein [Thermoanaerobaculia bacterium]
MHIRSLTARLFSIRPAAVALLVVALAAVPVAAAAQSPAAGTWTLDLDFQGNAVTVTMVITETDGKLGGTWTTPRGAAELESVTVEDGKLVASWTREVQGQSASLSYEGTIDGDTITGQMVTPMGGMMANGKRAGAATPAAGGAGGGAAVGEWKVTSVSQLGSLERTLVVSGDGTGIYSTGDATYPLRNVVMEGNHLAFDVTVSAQGQELPLHFEGDVDGDAIAGKFSNDQAGGELATVTGKRQ